MVTDDHALRQRQGCPGGRVTEELAKVPQVPGSLDESVAALEADHEFLLAGGVFTRDVIDGVHPRRVTAIRIAGEQPGPAF